MSRVKVTFELDLKTGEYEVQYNSAVKGEPIDFIRTMQVLRLVVGDHQERVVEDGLHEESGQVKLTRG